MIPGLPPLPPAAPQTQTASANLAIPNPPDWLNRLPSGSVIQGVVQEKDSSGLTTVATAHGTFNLSLNAPAHPGALISLQLQAKTNQPLQAQLLTIDPPPTPSGFSNSAVILPEPTTAALRTAQVGDLIAATVIKTNLPATTVALAQNTHSAAPTPTSPVSGSPVSGSPVSGPPISGTPSPPTPLWQSGDTLAVKLLAIARPETASLGAADKGLAQTVMPSLSQPGSQLGAFSTTVIANSTSGQPIVVGNASLMILSIAPLPPGSTVTLLPQPTGLHPGMTASTTSPAAFPTYPSLPDLAEAASDSSQTASNPLISLLPKPGSALAGELLRFLNAARKGDLNSLIPSQTQEKLEKTAKGKSALQGLRREFAEASRSTYETTGQDWRSFTLPIFTQGAIEPIRLYLHGLDDDRDQGRKGGNKPGQRFMIEINLTALGAIQIDGLAKSNQLDIVLRTPRALTAELQQGLTQFFGELLPARGLNGQLIFQVAPPLSVMSPAPAGPSSRSGILA